MSFVFLHEVFDLAHSGKSATIRESNHGSGLYVWSIMRSTMYQKPYFVSWNWRIENKFCSMWGQLY